MSVEGSISNEQTAPDAGTFTVNDDQELGAIWDRIERDNGAGRDDAGRFSSASGGNEQDPLEGGEGDLIVLSHDFYSLYETGEQQLQRYMDADMAQSGFVGLKYKTADVIFDDNTNFTTTSERGYFLNTDYLYINQHKEAQWTQDDEKRPVNQDAVVIPYYWMGNLVCSNRSLQGILIDVA